MTRKTYGEVLYWASSFLGEHNKEKEAAEYLMARRLGWSKTDLLMHLRKIMPKNAKRNFEADIQAFSEGMPAQYILGTEEFFGETFKVTPATLIPRPETEELVQLCLDNNRDKEHITVVDVGTGTGIIAITLKRLKPTWHVIATDISESALEVAKENAAKHGVEIEFHLGDLLEPVFDRKLDIIISNPPYISVDEWEDMDESVREHEPEGALFAPNRGLFFYEKFLNQLPQVLAVDGCVYFEFGFKQGRELQQMYQSAFPTKKVSIKQDLSGNDRMLEMK